MERQLEQLKQELAHDVANVAHYTATKDPRLAETEAKVAVLKTRIAALQKPTE